MCSCWISSCIKTISTEGRLFQRPGEVQATDQSLSSSHDWHLVIQIHVWTWQRFSLHRTLFSVFCQNQSHPAHNNFQYQSTSVRHYTKCTESCSLKWSNAVDLTAPPLIRIPSFFQQEDSSVSSEALWGPSLRFFIRPSSPLALRPPDLE